MKSTTKKPSILFWQFSLSYFLLLLIPLFMGPFIYHSSSNILEDQISRYNAAVLKNASLSIENSLNYIDNFVFSLNGMPAMNELLRHHQDSSSDVIASINYNIQKLPILRDSNQLIINYYLFNSYNKYLFAPGQGFLDLNKYYESHFSLSGYQYSEWLSAISDPKNMNGLMAGNKTNFNGSIMRSLLYIYPLSLSSNGFENNLLLIYLNENQVTNMLKPALNSGATSVCMLDENGNPLITYGIANTSQLTEMYEHISGDAGHFSKTINNEAIIIDYYVSDEFGYIYYTSTPRSILTIRISEMLTTITVITGLMILIGLILAFIMTYINRKPLISISNRLAIAFSDTSYSIRGLRSLESRINSFVNYNENLSIQLHDYKEKLAHSFFSRLIIGDFNDDNEIRSVLLKLGIDANALEYRGAYVEIFDCIKSIEHMNIMAQIHTLISDSFFEYKNAIMMQMVDDHNRIVLLIKKDDIINRDIVDIIKISYSHLKNKYGFDTIWYLGSPSINLMSVNKSFSTAKMLINKKSLHSSNDSNSFIIMEDDKPTYDLYQYTLSQEQKILNAVKYGNHGDICKLLKDIYNSNFIQNNLSGFVYRLLYNRLLSTLVSACYNSNQLDSEMLEGIINETPEQFFIFLSNEYKHLCDQRKADVKEKYNKLAQEVADYISENYTDTELSLSKVALHFGMNETYLSSFFKEHHKIKFFDFIEHQRINKANELLKRHKLTITEVAQAVGYSNLNSFSRAFKRVMGYSPSLCKKTITLE